MKKIRLDIANLRVDSFETGDGGVHAEQCRVTLMHSTCKPGTAAGLCLPQTDTNTETGTLWTDAGSTCEASCDALGTCLSCPGHATCADGLDTCSYTCFYGVTCVFDCT